MMAEVSFDDFKKVDLRTAKIVSAERVEGSEKLLKLLVDIGEEKLRQIIAGIGLAYEPPLILGREIIVVANLAPRVIMGLESQGMILAASDGRPVLLQPERKVPPGSEVR